MDTLHLMAVTDLVEQLAAHKTLGSAPRAELEWIAAHGIMRHLEKNEVLTRADKNISVEGLFVVLSGRIAIYVDRGSGTNKVMEWKAGDVTGFLPYSRMGNPPGDTVAQEPSTALLVKREHFPELIRECQEVTAILVHKMLDRAREFKSKDLLDERLMSLGRISARHRPRVEQPGVGHRAQRGVARQAARGSRACRPCARGGETHRRATRGGRRAPVLLYDRDSPRRAVADPAGRARRCDQRLARCASFACRHRDGARRERGHDRGARPVRESRRWSAARSGAPMGGGRGLGSRARLRSSRSGDAHLRPRPVDQRLLAHGSGHRRRAGGFARRVEQHHRRPQVEGPEQVGFHRRYRRAEPSEGARLHRRAESDLGQSDRQRARRGGSGWTYRHHRKPG